MKMPFKALPKMHKTAVVENTEKDKPCTHKILRGATC